MRSQTGGPRGQADADVPVPRLKYGITEPLSLQEPSDADLALSEQMHAELEAAFPAETAEGMACKQGVLREIEQMVTEWMAKESTVTIIPLGSYRLGVMHHGSDIDALCIGPPNVRREDFFASFVEKLNQHEHVTKCVPIPDAYTPIIKLKMRGVCIDLLFARLARPLADGENPEEVVKDDEVLMSMDDKSVRCINGLRVADQILQLVPNQETFRCTLRFVKYWAKRRGIYSNVLGFFGGIAWSLLVARVCQLYPRYAPSQLVDRFFWMYYMWNWPKPVMLCKIVDPQNVPGMTNFKVWNPKNNPADRQHVMPVITPAFPAMNSTYNVTETTKRIMLEEFRRGYEMVKSVRAQKVTWSEVNEPFPFFTHFRHFLWLEVLVKTDEDDRGAQEVYNKFSGWVESKLRILVMQLENVSGMAIHPNPMQYDLCGSNSEWPLGCGMFIAMSFTNGEGAYIGQKVDLRNALSQFVEVINQWSDKDLYAAQFTLRLKRIKGSELPEYARDPEARASPSRAN